MLKCIKCLHMIYTGKYKNILVRSGGVVKITDFQKDSSSKIMTFTLLSLSRSQILWYFKRNDKKIKLLGRKLILILKDN